MSAQGKLRWILVLACFAGIAPARCAAQVILTGRVLDENKIPVRYALVSLHRAGPAAVIIQAQTDPTGVFTLSLPEPGEYLIDIEREGFYALRERSVQVPASSQEITVTINTIREVFQSVNVNEQTSPAELSATSNQSRLNGTEVNEIQYANSHSLRNGLQLLPEVVEDQTGTLHVNGSEENQVLYLLNGFNLTNPISGQLQTTLAVEGIRSINLSSGRYSPEYGKATAGVLAMNSENGTDRFHYTMTDFIPGIKFQQGVRLGNWYPRFVLSGPIVRCGEWFSDMAECAYTQSLITRLLTN